MKSFLRKLIGNLLICGAYFAICFMLELPMTSVVFSLSEHDDPNLVTIATMTVGLLLTLYAIYLKRLRNDSVRRQYLTDIRRQYGSFRKDIGYILTGQSYRLEVASFSLLFGGLMVRVAFWGLEVQLHPAIAIMGALLCWALGIVLYALIDLLMINATHRAWIDALIVPDESDEAAELRRKKSAMIRNYVFQFAFSLSFWVLYLLNSYAVTFAIVVTPALFIYSQVQGIMGILHMRNIDQPYKTYVKLQIISLGFYIFSLLFGSFAPKL